MTRTRETCAYQHQRSCQIAVHQYLCRSVHVQHLIDALTRLPPSQSKRTCIQQRRDLRTTITQHGVVLKPYKSTCDVDASLSDLRQRMRKLRRWRNGSESWSVSELEELVEFLLLTKANVVTYRLSLLLAVIDVMRKQWQVGETVVRP